MADKYVIKASGEQEQFDPEKFRRSLVRAGARPDQIKEITQYVIDSPELTTTEDIYNYAFNQLKKHRPAVAARYSLKQAISQLGPSGFPFEHFIAALLAQEGYHTEIDQIVQGFCITHEVDIILTKNNKRHLVECKFHVPHIHADVKVPLYIKARFDDIQKKEKRFDEAWVVTNTRFSSDAIAYAQCVHITLLSWDYPENNSIARLVDRLGFHPITALTSLTSKQKNYLIQHGLVVCKDADKYSYLLKDIGLSENQIQQVLQEAHEMCKLGAIE